MKKFNSSIHSQRMRLLERLKKGPITTLEARHELDILGVAPRIYELRHRYGHNILRYWKYEQNPGGGSHRVARYVLISGKWEKNSDE